MWILNELFEIVLFPRKTTGTDKFYQAIIIDQNTVWMHISYFYVIFLKLWPSSNQSVQKVPQLSLQKVSIDVFSVLDLNLKDIRVVLIF